MLLFVFYLALNNKHYNASFAYEIIGKGGRCGVYSNIKMAQNTMALLDSCTSHGQSPQKNQLNQAP